MSKEKLITLFKQCCDNNKHIKVKALVENPNSQFDFKSEGIQMSHEQLTVLNKSGFEDFKFNEGISPDGSRGRVFKFDSEPPLAFFSASITCHTKIKRIFSSFGPIIKFPLFKEEYKTITTYRKNFWGKEVKRERKEPVQFFARKVNMPTFPTGYNLRQISYDESDYLVFGHIDTNKNTKAHFWAQDNLKKYRNSVKYSGIHYNHNDVGEMHVFENDNLLHEKICNKAFYIKGGILSFGEVWAWLTFEEHAELEKYYLESLVKLHKDILDTRIEETK